MLKMADSDVVENISGDVSKIHEKKRKSKKGISRDYARDVKYFAIRGSKSKFQVKSKSNSGVEKDEDERVPRLVTVSNSKTIIGEKRKVETCTGTSSLLEDDKFTEIFKDVGSGKLKKVKRGKHKGKMNRNFNDSNGNEHIFHTKRVEDSNLNSNCDDNSATAADKKLLHPAINYLVAWKKDKSTWSFKKSRQVWLLKNMYDVTKVLYVVFLIYRWLLFTKEYRRPRESLD